MRDASVNWQKILTQGFASADELLTYLNLPTNLASNAAQQQFKTRVPRGFAARMEQGNARDPLLLQVLAAPEELQSVAGYITDPLIEADKNPLQGLLHKYRGRVLLTLSTACAINCRYCFRRHFPYQNNNPGREGWRKVYEYIANDPSITEVILSGGDPLVVSDTLLAEVIDALNHIPHLRSLRFHSRMPIVLPERIDTGFLTQLQRSRLRKIMVLHCNHAQELDESVRDACTKLKNAGCHLLNQSVLLKGVNDDAQVLAKLSEALFDCQVLPYYLHVLDKTANTAHFDLPRAQVLAIYRHLQTLLPGYLVPRLVCEEPGQLHKTLLSC